ncbi:MULTISPECIES: hypothetical protein [Rhizobiaceae]|jgi:hypothetical protein|uniref:KTSC domain-containing protein n=1 Tax=Aliirhizobium cellulosilyticum TaxID=393664 RepID=A0A7W6S6B2_9HYPH|nr:hypothetical protein [Rhizobium cellulosilyticum]MBB4347398.1 hypothetical protein [Rhizobium cellulosilyticum]MBB4410208.1 hypothetical protein [Rhizobium cellulosilyticum]MBB4444895.1 hypothetical protein [Rhizobium cellulosilyticum]
MKLTFVSTLLIALAPALTESASAASITYGSLGIIKGSDVENRFLSARDECTLEASTPPRGHPFFDNFLNQAALRACLYRQGFSSKGDYVYPVPLFGNPVRSR